MPKAIAALVAKDGGQSRPVFSFSLVDHAYEGRWGWRLLDDSTASALLNFICEMAKLSWQEVRSQGASGHLRHHSQDVESLCSEAQKRIEALQYDDIQEPMFRFRVNGTSRLWGWEVAGIFHAVWWDPNHKVYPTERD